MEEEPSVAVSKKLPTVPSFPRFVRWYWRWVSWAFCDALRFLRWDDFFGRTMTLLASVLTVVLQWDPVDPWPFVDRLGDVGSVGIALAIIFGVTIIGKLIEAPVALDVLREVETERAIADESEGRRKAQETLKELQEQVRVLDRPVVVIEARVAGKLGQEQHEKLSFALRVRNKGGRARFYGTIDYFRIDPIRSLSHVLESYPIVWHKRTHDDLDVSDVQLTLERYCDCYVCEINALNDDGTFNYAAPHYYVDKSTGRVGVSEDRLNSGCTSFLVRVSVATDPGPLGGAVVKYFEVSPKAHMVETSAPDWILEIDEGRGVEWLRDMRGF